MVEWPARATHEPLAKLTFRAMASNGFGDILVQELPIYRDVTPETTATGGVITVEAVSEAVYLPNYAEQTGGGLELSLQSTLVGILDTELRAHLYRFPAEDVVRTASRLTATIGVRRAAHSSGEDVRPFNPDIDADTASIVIRQKTDGGWSWCSQCPSDPNVTALALIALGEAKREGSALDEGVLAKARMHVNGYLNRPSDVNEPADANQKALLLYGLAAAGSPNRSAAFAVQEQYRDKLTNWGRAYLALAMLEAGVEPEDSHLRETLNDLAMSVIPSANGNHWEDEPVASAIHTNVRTTALVAEALVRVAPNHPLIEETVRWLVVARGAERWTTTVERGQAILSLSEFAAKTGELAGDYEYRARLGDQDLLQGRFQRDQGPKAETKRIPLTSLPLGHPSILTLLRDFTRPGQLYYTLNLSYLTPATHVDALNHGIAISHGYSVLDDEGIAIDRISLGQTVRVRVTVVAPNDLNYVVVDDLLPGGLEPIDPKLRTVDAKLKAQLDADRARAVHAKQASSSAPWFRWYYSPWQHVDLRDDRVSLFADRLPKGVHEYIYYARATTPGSFFVPPAHVEETYFPEVFGRGDSMQFTITP